MMKTIFVYMIIVIPNVHGWGNSGMKWHYPVVLPPHRKAVRFNDYMHVAGPCIP